MIIKNVAIQGFRSFKKDQVLEFPESDGFFLLSGENELEPDLGANGCGKSSIWDALTWAFFGRTARGLRAGSVANWDREQVCSVMVHFSLNDHDYDLTRTWDPNSLSIGVDKDERKVITQEELEHLIAFDYPSFLNVVLMGQFNRYFFDLSPAEKLQVFSEVLQLQLWLEASTRARENSKELDVECRKLEQDEATLRGEINGLGSQIKQLKRVSDEFEAGRMVLIKELEEKVVSLMSDETDGSEKLGGITRVLADQRSQQKKHTEELKKWDDKKTKLGAERYEILGVVRVAENDVVKLEREKEKIKQAKGKCPFCRQTVSAEHIRTELAKIDDEITLINEQRIAKLRKDLSQLDLQVARVEGQLVDIDAALDEVEKQVKKLSLNEATERSRLKGINNQLGELERRLKEEKEKVNTSAELLESTHGKIATCEKKQREVADNLVITKAKRDHAAFWVKGFKELRLWLIEEALKEFEIEVGNSLIQLGLHGWKITFDVERETTSGGVSKGFTVLISAPESTEQVPWEAWSGGETQRLRIAGALGLARLISNRRGIECNIEVWDEPTAHLSEEGIDNLLTFFEGRARDGKQIWLVDHRSLNYGGFDDEIRVVKDRSGSRIIQVRDRAEVWS